MGKAFEHTNEITKKNCLKNSIKCERNGCGWVSRCNEKRIKIAAQYGDWYVAVYGCLNLRVVYIIPF